MATKLTLTLPATPPPLFELTTEPKTSPSPIVVAAEEEIADHVAPGVVDRMFSLNDDAEGGIEGGGCGGVNRSG